MAPAWSEAAIDIEDLARRNGLRPRRSGQRLRFICPACGTKEKRRASQSASAALNIERNPWHCFRCDIRGTAASLAVLLGDLAASPRESGPALSDYRLTPAQAADAQAASETPAAGRIHVARGWAEVLEATTVESVAAIERWAVSRGWPHHVIHTVATSDWLAHVGGLDASGRTDGAKLAAAAQVRGLNLLVPVRDANGITRQMARRWDGEGRAPKPKSMSLSVADAGDADTWGGVWAYGSIPDALAAAKAGHPVYIVEGAPDYLALAGLMVSRGLPGAVVGAYNDTTAVGLVRSLCDTLGAQGMIAPRVVIVPHNDAPTKAHPRGAGAEAAERMADRLRGRAGVFLANLPPHIGDLSDALRDLGEAKLLGLLDLARCLYPAPVALEQAKGEMEIRLKRAVLEATSRTSSAHEHTLVIFEVAPGAGKSHTTLDLVAQIVNGGFKIPVNGRRPRGVAEADWPPPERSVVFALADHGLVAEKVCDLDRIAPGTPSRHLRGLMEHCAFTDNIADVYPSVGRRGICGLGTYDQLCEHADTCEGAQAPKAKRGEVTFVPHVLLPRLRADLVVVDESPGVVGLSTTPTTAVVSLFACKQIPKVQRWFAFQNPDAPRAAQKLCELLSPIGYDHASRASSGEVSAYSRRVWGKDLVTLLESKRGLVDLLVTGFGPEAKPPPVPMPNDARAGAYQINAMPSRLAFMALVELTAYYLREKRAQQPELEGIAVNLGPRPPEPVCCIRLDVSGEWFLEVRRVKDLPKAPVLMLDATGGLTLEEWQHAYPDRKVVIRALDVQGAAPAKAIHLASQAFSRRSLLDAVGLIRAEAASRVCRVLDDLAHAARLNRGAGAGAGPVRLGVLTHAPLARALAGDGQIARAGGGATIRAHVKALEAKGVVFANEAGVGLFGWFGRHDRGTNAFEGVDAFAVLGDPVANVGDIDADAVLLGLDGGKIAAARAAATCQQAIARARHIRREAGGRVVLLFAGRTAPDVPGVVWAESELPDGAPIADDTRDLGELCLHIGRTLGVLGLPVLERFDRSSTRWADLNPQEIPIARRRRVLAWAAEILHFGLHSVSGAGRLLRLAAISPEHASGWAAGAGLMGAELQDQAGF